MALDNWYGISGLPSMTAAVVKPIPAALEQTVASDAVQDRMRQMGLEAKAMGGDPFKHFIADQGQIRAEAVQVSGAKVE